MTRHGYHPEALLEFAEATNYYLREAPPGVAEAFVAMIETAVEAVCTAPKRWRVLEDSEIRRYVLRRFPYVLYYRYETEPDRVTIYAVMHCSREPGYWKSRID